MLAICLVGTYYENFRICSTIQGTKDLKKRQQNYPEVKPLRLRREYMLSCGRVAELVYRRTQTSVELRAQGAYSLKLAAPSVFG